MSGISEAQYLFRHSAVIQYASRVLSAVLSFASLNNRHKSFSGNYYFLFEL
jgi:hypothetical protein